MLDLSIEIKNYESYFKQFFEIYFEAKQRKKIQV